jgi:hypothetical protein
VDPSPSRVCSGCQLSAPEHKSGYTVIQSGWRVTRPKSAHGIAWWCPPCWKTLKASSATPQRKIN